ncbi:uncharacterized protein LOC127701023 [Mytilus californianus]|uniref:uncharacterized protein LOC127701023 n=1 Tax=Mytilus californianus TaxID=6549 RepID=UPI0022450C75|nr:uncharacterized protein LOC127701023 [Mytilus californianus]
MAENITPNLSIALYRYMCQNIVGTEGYVKRIRLMNAVRDDMGSNKIMTKITSGSFGEGLEMRGSDLDLMYVINTCEVYDVIKPRFDPYTTFFSMETEDVKPGFTRLKHEYTFCRGQYFEMFEEHNGEYYISSALCKQNFVCDKGQIIHGPCISDKNGVYDGAFSLHCKTWISPAVQWITRSSNSWPSHNIKQSIIKHGVLFVPLGVKESPTEDLEWRVSFSVGEKLLINSFTHTQLLCYALLKIILKDVITSYSECKDLLCSYFLKTIIFWLSEELPQSVWKPGNIIPCFMRCFNRLVYCVENSVCLHYFIPENNMFENKIEGRAREILLEKLYTLHSYGWRCIFLSSQISKFDVSMWNIPIEPQTLYVQEIDKFMKSKLLNSAYIALQSVKSIFNNRIIQRFSCQQSSLKHVYKYCISNVCHLDAQFIALDRTLCENKYQYIQYKSCLSILLRNVHHDVVSGWLMVASFFYKTKQYNTALHFIIYSVSKCTTEKLHHCMTMSDIHIHLLKLQTFLKNSFVCLLKVMFVDNVQFEMNSTLIPDELQMDESNRIHHFPSAAYAYFLKFLCHYHLNNVKLCQNSLHVLQLIVKENFLIADMRHKGEAFNLLGVALHIFGDKESARKVFLHSAEYFPDHFKFAVRRLLLMN